jgi:hypothetical protein
VILVDHSFVHIPTEKIVGLLVELCHGALCVPIQNYQAFMPTFQNTCHGYYNKYKTIQHQAPLIFMVVNWHSKNNFN